MKFFLIIITFLIFVKADDYELGHGYKVNDVLHLGSYFSVDYTQGKSIERLRLDDAAFLAYGNLLSKFSYFAELEAAPFYTYNLENRTSQKATKFHIERTYINYMASEMINLRFGKQIAPIGYWNLEPINVLRDTSSNPLYSSEIFPKFLTGVDSSGYLNEDYTLNYHIFLQATDDLDEYYINIKTDFYLGAALAFEYSDSLQFGSTLAYFETKDIIKHTSLLQVNAKYDNYPFLLQTEWAYANIDNKSDTTTASQLGGYVQNMYNFTPKHALVGRYEYFKDTQVKQLKHIGIIGYSYRPIYSISLKAEYQFNSDVFLNQFITSFSVLF